MENEEHFLDDTDFVDYMDTEFPDAEEDDIVERELKALDYYDSRANEIPFEHEIRLIDDF